MVIASRIGLGVLLALAASIVVGCSGAGHDDPAGESDQGALRTDTATKKSMVFDCRSEIDIDDAIASIKFSVQDMGPHMHINPPTKVDESDDSPVKATGDRVAELNDNLTFGLKGNNFTINGDSDGFYAVKLRLYKDSGFKRGYLRISGDESPQYSKIECEVTEKDLPVVNGG
jgi:hypothetical protein